MVPLLEIPRHAAPLPPVSLFPESLAFFNVAEFGIGGGPHDVTDMDCSFRVGGMPNHANEIMSDLHDSMKCPLFRKATRPPLINVHCPPMPVIPRLGSTLPLPATDPPFTPAGSTTATFGRDWHGCQGRLRRKKVVDTPVPFGVAEAYRLPGVVSARWGHAAVRLNGPASPLEEANTTTHRSSLRNGGRTMLARARRAVGVLAARSRAHAAPSVPVLILLQGGIARGEPPDVASKGVRRLTTATTGTGESPVATEVKRGPSFQVDCSVHKWLGMNPFAAAPSSAARVTPVAGHATPAAGVVSVSGPSAAGGSSGGIGGLRDGARGGGV